MQVHRLIIALAIALVACGGPTVRSGRIVEKNYNAPYDSSHYQCYTRDSDGNCTFGMYVTDHHDAEWQIRLQNCDYADGKCHSTWWDVDQQTYDSLEVGSYYSVGSNA